MAGLLSENSLHIKIKSHITVNCLVDLVDRPVLSDLLDRTVLVDLVDRPVLVDLVDRPVIVDLVLLEEDV